MSVEEKKPSCVPLQEQAVGTVRVRLDILEGKDLNLTEVHF